MSNNDLALWFWPQGKGTRLKSSLAKVLPTAPWNTRFVEPNVRACEFR